MRRFNGFGLGAFVAGSVVGCAAPDGAEAPAEARGESAQRIELHDRDASYGFAFAPTTPLQAGEDVAALHARLRRRSFPLQATGAIIAPYLDAAGVPITQNGSKVRFTCGATLVSPSYVVTAAHCVDPDSIKVPTDTVTLEMYRPTTRLALEEVWRPKTELSGTFPNYQHPSYGVEDGYHVDRYSCTLTSRCGYGTTNCPNTSTATDVALLRCEGRPGERYGYLNVAASERQGVEVYVPWKHEVYDIAESEPTTSDKFLHYVKYPSTYADNYHYLDRNQLLPLESIAWPDGTRPRKVSDANQLTVWTDALGCHGTSGSGFLQQDPSSGAWELLGPTAVGGSAFGGLLCQHLPGVASQPTPSPGQQNIGYSSLIQTRTVLTGSSAAWAADCATQPLGHFSLGGRSGCSRVQSGLSFGARAAFRDLDPWLSPTLPIAAARTTGVGSVSLQAGQSYRVALGGAPLVNCSLPSVCPAVSVRIGGTEVLRTTLQALAGETLLASASFVASSVGAQVVSVVTTDGAFELGSLEVVPSVETLSFDTGYERAEAALLVPSASASLAMPMRFVGDGAQGFAGLLYPGERLLLPRRAVALPGELSLRFTSSGAAPLNCGLLDRSGVVLASTSCLPGTTTSLVHAGATAAAVFIDGASAGEVQLDDVSVGFAPLASSPCTDGLKNGTETDVDCGGASCARCSNGKACVALGDCVSNLCSSGICVAAPTCTDGLKNGTETDVDCGGSCSQDCGVGKSCGTAADCLSNVCTAGKCVAAPTCTDGLKNGTETDVDCGGSCSQDCGVGKSCGVAADCVSNLCTAGKCVALPSGVKATLSFSSTWDAGYCANVTVTNGSSTAISSWTAVVSLAQSSVTSSWSASFSTSGSTLTARSLSWNGQLTPNASTVFGFCANKTGTSWQPSVVSAASP